MLPDVHRANWLGWSRLVWCYLVVKKQTSPRSSVHIYHMHLRLHLARRMSPGIVISVSVGSLGNSSICSGRSDPVRTIGPSYI